jgi:polysaccharide chain length determinant protein (PEP-CTERM system associated)
MGEEPRTVAAVTQRLASLFIDENLKDREVMAEGSYEFIDSQLEDARTRLLAHEKKLEEYSRRFDGQLPSQLQWNLQMISGLQTQIRQVNESIARDRERRLLLERSIADATAVDAAPSSAAGAGDVSAGTAAQQLEAARQSLLQMELRLKPEHPDVVMMRRTIQRLAEQAEAEQLGAALSPADNPALTAQERAKQNRLKQLRAELADLDRHLQEEEQEEQQLRDSMVSYQARVEATPSRSTELVELTRDYDTLQQSYKNLLFKKEDSKIAANLEKRQIGEQFKILDPARVPEKPYSPDRSRIGLLGIAFGLCFGVGLAALFEYQDSSLKSDDDVLTALSLPVLALVPLMTTKTERRKLQRRRLAAAVSSAALVLVAVALAVWQLTS